MVNQYPRWIASIVLSLVFFVASTLWHGNLRVRPLPRFHKAANVASDHSLSAILVGHDASTPPTIVMNRNTTRFVFIVGLEGTGHHLMSLLLRRSPNEQLIREKRFIKGKLGEVMRSFFNGGLGLMDAFCKDDGAPKPQWNETMRQAADAMRGVRDAVDQLLIAGGGRGRRQYPDILLNAAGRTGSMWSYPTDFDCGRHKSPSLDVFYETCEAASVSCGHVYLYRDPREVVASTTIHRQFNSNVLQALRLYTDFLQLLYGALSQHGARTLACVGFYEEMDRMEAQWEVVRMLGGWDDGRANGSAATTDGSSSAAFDQLLRSVYRPPTPESRAEARQLVPEGTYGPHLRALQRAHDAVLELCRGQVRANAGLMP